MHTELALIPTPPSPAAPRELAPPGSARPDLVAAFLGGKKPTTVREYRKDLAEFARHLRADSTESAVEWFLGRDAGRANELVLGWKNEQLARGLSSATISRRLAAVRSLVKLARTLGRVTWSVEIQGPKAEPKRDMRGPGEEGLKRIKRALKKCPRRDRAIFYLLFGLGLRRAEAAGVDLADVDFAASKIYVLGKARREKIALEMGEEVMRALADWVVVRGNHPGPLFHRTDGRADGKPLNLGTVNVIVGAIGRAAGLPGKLRPHGARHAAITELFRRGKTVPQVMGFSRHVKPETVMRYHDELMNDAGDMARELSKSLG
jgi:integrase/recombinase XerC